MLGIPLDELSPAFFAQSPFAILPHFQLPLEPQALISRLGGTVKIGTEIGTLLTEDALIDTMARYAADRAGKVLFGISLYQNTPPSQAAADRTHEWAKEVKERLKDAGRSARFVPGEGGMLNTATVFHNKLHTSGAEFLVTEDNGRYSLAVTRAVQPLDELSARDFGRPGRDDVSGMLPPKLAMMMINLAISDLKMKIFTAARRDPVVATKRDPAEAVAELTILDPFCGSGTILTEALRLGCAHLIGTDISEKAVTDTLNNIAWTKKQLNNVIIEQSGVSVSVSDAVALCDHISTPADIIVTEPYMGPPLRGGESPEQIKKTTNELAALYLRAFESFTHVLKPTANVVFVIPRFTVAGHTYTISDKIIGKLKDLGFAKERLLPESLSPSTYILYQRPKQFVGREIWKFSYKK